MQSAVNTVDLADDLAHKSCLEEIVFWMVKYEFPEKITTWLLGLLPDDPFKVCIQRLTLSSGIRLSFWWSDSVFA